MKQDPRAFPEAAHEAMGDPRLKLALGRIKSHFQMGGSYAAGHFEGFEALRERGAAIRDHALAHLDTLLEQFEASVTARGGHVHWARDAKEAREIVHGILKAADAKTVTKGKSMVTEEIELNPFLEAHGMTPVETDLGEYIIQLRDEPPSHIIAPAFHLNKEDVAETFRAAHTSLDPARNIDERTALVNEARIMLREAFEGADAGITGANFLSAEDGAAVIVTNEGNGDLTRLLPKTHIVVTGIEKVVPDLNDVAVLLRLLTRSATGQAITSYVSVMAGPRGPGETDGPEHFHVVLVDNGRTRLLGTEARGDAALHPLFGLPQPLPDLCGGGRPCLWRDLSGADRGGAEPEPARACRSASPSQCLDFLRALRGGVSRQNSAAQDHALLAGARIRSRHGASECEVRTWVVGLRGQTAGALPAGCAHGGAAVESCWAAGAAP